MTWLWILLTFTAGYVTAEWPRLLWCRKEKAILIKGIPDPKARRLAYQYPIWVLVVAIPWIFIGMGLGRSYSPPRVWDEYWFLWCVFLFTTASGIGTGIFELASRMTPDHLWIHSSIPKARFYCDRELSLRNGQLRIGTCIAMTAAGLLGIHWL